MLGTHILVKEKILVTEGSVFCSVLTSALLGGGTNGDKNMLYIQQTLSPIAVVLTEFSSTLFVATIMGVMTRMGARGEVLVTVRDQGRERVDCVGWLHNRNFIGLWKKKQK